MFMYIYTQVVGVGSWTGSHYSTYTVSCVTRRLIQMTSRSNCQGMGLSLDDWEYLSDSRRS